MIEADVESMAKLKAHSSQAEGEIYPNDVVRLQKLENLTHNGKDAGLEFCAKPIQCVEGKSRRDYDLTGVTIRHG